ncbi:efflux RND transporter periplasmic adaptor subunit [Hyphomonas sp.]|uniref:efflux RND transporter periplasmic adaptor subunit n=1 Tax=Hyphomonas sp. TaxID=87 RepID=UPI001BCE2385|nr:efflux RND transporter periplasmic adaptor subunit [Hyphomonas sp.]
MLKLVRKNPFRTTGAALVAVLLIAAPALTQQRGGGPGGAGGPPPSSVFAEPVREQTFASRVEAIGTLEPNERADLTLTASDRVTAVYFQDGDRVKQGKTLLSLAQREQLALVESAEADLAQANQDLARVEPLAQQGAVSTSELDMARRNVNAAAAQLRAVQSRQNDRVLVAPFDGVLGFRRVSVGSLVRPGDVVATLIDDSVMRLEFAVPSNFLRVLRPGLEIEAASNDIPGQVFTGTVDSIDNMIDPVTRSIRVRANVQNPSGILKSGMYMAVALQAEPRRALSVPEVALQPRGPETFVWVAATSGTQTVARRVRIEPGLRLDGRVEIVAGLSEGQMVITEGALRVREGAPVVIKDESMLQPKPAARSGSVGGSAVNLE